MPFPQRALGRRWANQNDFENSEVSELVIHGPSSQVVQGSLAITSLENYQRFCSNYLATLAEGFEFPLLFTNEEAQDWVYRRGDAWPGPNYITPGTHGAEQAGVVVAYNPLTGQRKTIYGMGRHNHENSVAVPGFSKRVVLSGDDTFQTNAPSSQLYMHGRKRERRLERHGALYAFRANARTTTTSIFSRARSSPARLSRCRRTSPAASRRWTVTS